MINQLLFSVLGLTGVIGFLVYYFLRKVKAKTRKKLILALIIISLFLGGGKIALRNPSGFIYNNSVISALNKKVVAKYEGYKSFGTEVNLSFLYNLFISPTVGAIFIGMAAGGMKAITKKTSKITYNSTSKLLNNNLTGKKIKRGDFNGSEEKTYE